MWKMTSNDVRVHWAKVVRYVRDFNGVVIARQYKTETVAVVPVDWYRLAVEAIGEPKLVAEVEQPEAKPTSATE
ncbi:hypothetical protein [Streptomyces sp. NBC_01264]|uniref:hypothetical protein n=1 Tax=Streptomyces sp. NBC_01264 TaxID=2903804 RepID=UPI00224FD0F1|nr:hypothetical protein [Streptomyces sp. NBC_01264]MCX4783320.1 hypothetical protein [Streptomyces sp. NBC_01264]